MDQRQRQDVVVRHNVEVRQGQSRVVGTSDIINFVNTGNDDIKFLARSIVLLWYLGSWYDPKDLQSKPRGQPARISSEVVSAKAYTQGLVWQIAGAHPMGYSNLQFGYWSRNPRDPNDPTPLLAPPKSP